MGTPSTTRTIDATTEPLSVNEVKDHLRIETDDDDNVIASLINEARDYVERITGRALITQTWTMNIDSLPECIYVPHAPLQSVTSIQYQDENNATQTLSSALYTVDTKAEPGRIFQAYNQSYPSTYSDLNAVTITYVAGYGSAATDVPETYKRAIKLYCEKMFDMPGAAYGDALNNALDSLLSHHKVDSIAL